MGSFDPWAKYLIVANSLLCTINSSCNFAFYCGDVVFRECLSAISKTKWKQTSAIAKCCKSQSATSANHEINLGIEEETDRENPNQILLSKTTMLTKVQIKP